MSDDTTYSATDHPITGRASGGFFGTMIQFFKASPIGAFMSLMFLLALIIKPRARKRKRSNPCSNSVRKRKAKTTQRQTKKRKAKKRKKANRVPGTKKRKKAKIVKKSKGKSKSKSKSRRGSRTGYFVAHSPAYMRILRSMRGKSVSERAKIKATLPAK